MFLQVAGNGVKIPISRNRAVGAKLSTASMSPTIDRHPVQLMDITFYQTAKGAIYAQHGVPTIDSQPDRHADGRVHPWGRSAAMKNGDSQATLALDGLVGLCPDQGSQCSESGFETGSAQRHCPLEIFFSYGLGHFPCLVEAKSERGTHDLIALHADNGRLVQRLLLNDGIHGCCA